MNNENYGDVDYLKTTNSETFCPFKSINLMDYSENVEKLTKNYSNDIKLLSCDEDNENNLNEMIRNEIKLKKSDQKSSNDLDENLETNLILCNSTNIFDELDEDVFENDLDNKLNDLEINYTDKKVNSLNNVLNDVDSKLNNVDKLNSSTPIRNSINQLPESGQKMISTNDYQTNKNLIDKNLISLATEKLLKNSQLEELIKDQPLMQVEDLETVLKNKKITDLNQNSRELIEQLSEQIENHLKDNEPSIDEQHDQIEPSIKEPIKEKQIELSEEQLIERLTDPVIERISDLTKNLINQQSIDLSKEDSQENKTNSQYHDDTIDSQNTTPVDSEFSFKYSSNRILLKDNSADYEEVFDDSYYDDDLNNSDESYLDRLKRLEEEQEHLNSSLIALTSHFAQVQLRLKQIVDADPELKENLLKELEEFAFRGIPDYRIPELDDFDMSSNLNDENNDQQDANHQKSNKLQLQRDKQKELILKLKEQLEDLEKYAYETGDSNIIPSSLIMERQNVIIEELKGKLPLELDQLEKMSPEELRKQIDKAIRDLVNPVIMKEQLVDQLKTQVSDLERFIEFLQEGKICIKSSTKKGGLIFDGTNANINQLIAKCKCNCTSKHSQECVSKTDSKQSDSTSDKQKTKTRSTNKSKLKTGNKKTEDDELNDSEKAAKMIKRALALLQMFTFVHFGCNTKSTVNKANKFERNTLKKTNKINHFGDSRAKLELTIEHLIELTKQKHNHDSDYTSECEETILIQTNEKITTTVRKQLCILLRDLLEHGLNSNLNSYVSNDDRIMNQNDYSSLMSWNCFSQRSRHLMNLNERKVTVWQVLVNYFYLKKGHQFRQTPARKLSLSFNLDIVGGVPITSKQTLLSCIDEIMDSHSKFKRSMDSHFKAFICRAINERRLVSWLKLIFKCKTIVNQFYEPWSYVNSTAFDEGLKSLDRLTNIDLPILPVDIAIRQFNSINEAF